MRRLALAIPFAILSVPLSGQVKPSAAIPATTPTQSVSDLPSAHPVMGTAAGNASVTWNGSMLTIQAKGDSLHNIVRAVSQATGMKITGGVPEEPVFGSYGPGAVQDVLPLLFNGISVNMMLVNDGAMKPRELLLTQRTGAASPPQTRTISDEDQGFRRGRNGPGTRQNANQGPPQPPPGTPNPGLPAPPQPPAPGDNLGSNAPGATPATTGTDANGQPASPNGTRTPEQIFEELRKRQAAATSSTPTQ